MTYNGHEQRAASSRAACNKSTVRIAAKSRKGAELIGVTKRTDASYGFRGAAGAKGYKLDMASIRARFGEPPKKASEEPAYAAKAAADGADAASRDPDAM